MILLMVFRVGLVLLTSPLLTQLVFVLARALQSLIRHLSQMVADDEGPAGTSIPTPPPSASPSESAFHRRSRHLNAVSFYFLTPKGSTLTESFFFY